MSSHGRSSRSSSESSQSMGKEVVPAPEHLTDRWCQIHHPSSDSMRVTELRIGSLNLRAYPNPSAGQIHGLAAIIAEQECAVVLLQECLRPWLEVICEATGMTV